MTPQEQQLIDGLISRIRSTPAAEKDADVDRYLHQNLDSVPDALYMLAQTVLVQQYGLQNAQQQIEDLKQQLDEARSQPPQQQSQHSGSFLGRIFGTDNPPQPQQSYQPVNAGYPAQPPYGTGYPPPPYAQPYGQPMYPVPGYGGGGGFLRGAVQTAAGVAAGEMMFQGMEDLFHGFGHEDRGFEARDPDRPSEIVNNYYDTDRPAGQEHHEDSRFSDAVTDAGNRPLSSDIEDRRGFADTGDNSNGNDQQGFEDSGSNDDSSFDDSGTFDDSGSFDDSSN